MSGQLGFRGWEASGLTPSFDRRTPRAFGFLLALALAACGTAPPPPASPDGGTVATGHRWDAHRFATRVISFSPGPNAGFGQSKLPGVVLGPPRGAGGEAGSLDVVSLGDKGSIVLGFDDDIVDGPGVDLIVFENAFPGNVETGVVSASEDGTTFHSWPCAADDADGGYPGCAGVHPVFANTDTNGIDPTDPAVAGGDAFDLAAVGLARAKFIRIEDSGANQYAGITGGFDLDAVAIVHTDPGAP